MTNTFSSLPVEIQRQCVSYLDTAALKSIRLTSQALRDITTEALFGVATLRLAEVSAGKFTALIESVEIRRCIREIYLDTQRDERCMLDECYLDPPPHWWVEAIAKWSAVTLPNLKRLTVDSAYACDDKHCAALRLAFTNFHSSADINAVTIKHLQDSCEIERPDFAQFRTKPKKLHLLVTTWSDEACPDHDIEIRHRHAFFNVHLSPAWLTPMQSQLTHLTLHCNTYWGVYPRWQPDSLHFPQLKSLALGKWTIAFDWQIDFITSHSHTLEQLILTDCPILHALRMTPRQSNNAWQQPRPGTSRGKPPTDNFFPGLRWHTVLPEFKSNLPELKHFAMGRGPAGVRFWGYQDLSGDGAFDDRYRLAPRIDSSRYAIFDFSEGPVEYEEPAPERGTRYKDGGWTWSYWLDRETDEDVKQKVRYPDCLQEDQEALEDLLRVIRGR